MGIAKRHLFAKALGELCTSFGIEVESDDDGLVFREVDGEVEYGEDGYDYIPKPMVKINPIYHLPDGKGWEIAEWAVKHGSRV